jgi:hypothetical protein
MRWSTVAVIATPFILAGVLAISADNKHEPTAQPRNQPGSAARPAAGVVSETREVPQSPLAHATASPARRGRRAPAQDLTPPLDLARARNGATSAVHAYAAQSVTWTWRTLGRQHQRLALLSAGRLRRANLAAARDVRALFALRHDGAGSRARAVRVKVITYLGETKAIAVVVTFERGYGRHADIHRWTTGAYRAVAERTDGGWAVTSWRSQS